MSSTSKSKPKGKKAGKESSKSSPKPLGHVNNGVIPASGYNPLLGTFHTFEATAVPFASPLHVNGRFRNIDDTDDHNGSSFGTEYDSVSNNGSWSGESEDHKEKTSQTLPRQESVPGAENDKREKIRQKNEKKHQRQKERRAQELHERCCGYLMSRKLEALAQQLVAMGFSQERATMALILNEGRVEESVAWLFEGAEDGKHQEHNLDGGDSLKIDILEELARITDMEIKYKASKQEVERAVLSCEGNLDKTEETLKTQKQEPPLTPPKHEETGDTATVANGKLPINYSQNAIRIQSRPTSYTGIEQKRDEKDFNYTKIPSTAVPLLDPGAKHLHVSNKIPPKMEWPKPHQISMPSEKRWPVSGSSPAVSYSLASSLQTSPSPAKAEARYVTVGNELKNLHLGSMRDPVMQRPPSINTKQVPSSSISSSPSGTAMGWYPNPIETMKPNGSVPPVAVTRSPSPNGASANPSYNQLHFQTQKQFVPGSVSMDCQGTTRGTNLWSRAGMTPIAAASSLGLFSGLGVNGSSGSVSPVDWTTGSSTMQFDYSNIDWSLDRGLLSSRPPNGLWTAPNYSIQNNAGTYDSVSYGLDINSTMRPVLSNGSGGSIPGLQDRVASSEPNVGGSREWTSPFEEKDIFSLPRQFVSSPSL